MLGGGARLLVACASILMTVACGDATDGLSFSSGQEHGGKATSGTGLADGAASASSDSRTRRGNSGYVSDAGDDLPAAHADPRKSKQSAKALRIQIKDNFQVAAGESLRLAPRLEGKGEEGREPVSAPVFLFALVSVMGLPEDDWGGLSTDGTYEAPRNVENDKAEVQVQVSLADAPEVEARLVHIVLRTAGNSETEDDSGK